MEEKRRGMSEKTRDRLPGKIITAVVGVAVICFICLLARTKMIPVRYMAIIGAVLAVLTAVTGLLVWKLHHLARFTAGCMFALVILAVLGIGGVYIHRTTSALDNISNVDTEVAQVGIYVKSEDSAQETSDTAAYTYGVLQELDRANTDSALKELNEELGTEVEIREYRGLTELIDGLKRGEAGAVILNQAYLDILEEMDGYAHLASEIRELTVRNVETVIEKKEAAPAAVSGDKSDGKETASAKKEKGKLYTIYISGIDNRGGIISKSRSDVNILATVNTETRQVLLVSTPRDYFVPLSISGGVPDKLTHAGIYGINVCMDTLGMLYDVDVNYYFRLNFGGFVNIIDALGGITVDSDYDFSTSGYTYVKGKNQVNGEQALAFARERYSFSEGDRQRGKNQMHVIEAVIDKALSPQLLKNYSSILSSLEGCFETNIPYEELALVMQRQLTNGGSWNVVTYSADGRGDTQKPYSMSQKAYVMIPDESTVEKAKTLMGKVRDGKTITKEEAAAAPEKQE